MARADDAAGIYNNLRGILSQAAQSSQSPEDVRRFYDQLAAQGASVSRDVYEAADLNQAKEVYRRLNSTLDKSFAGGRTDADITAFYNGLLGSVNPLNSNSAGPISYTPAAYSGGASAGSASPGSSVHAAGAGPGTDRAKDWNPGTAQDMAKSLGLDWGKLLSGLSGEDYLANRDPSYEWQQAEAAKAIQASAAARGGALGGGTLRSLQDRASQIAALDYQNAYNRDLQNRTLGLGQVTEGFNRSAQGHNFTLADLANYRNFDLGNRGLDVQAQTANANNSTQTSIANAQMQTQASMQNAQLAQQAALQNAQYAFLASQANADYDISRRGQDNQMTQAQWQREISQRGLNLQERNDMFARDLQGRQFDLQGLQFAANQENINSNRGMAGVEYGSNFLGQQQKYLAGLATQGLSNVWENQQNQQNLLGGLIQTGYGASGNQAQGNYGMIGGLLGSGQSVGSGMQAGSQAAGNAWSGGLTGANNAIQGGIGNYLLQQYLSNGGGYFGGGAIAGNAMVL